MTVNPLHLETLVAASNPAELDTLSTPELAPDSLPLSRFENITALPGISLDLVTLTPEPWLENEGHRLSQLELASQLLGDRVLKLSGSRYPRSMLEDYKSQLGTTTQALHEHAFVLSHIAAYSKLDC